MMRVRPTSTSISWRFRNGTGIEIRLGAFLCLTHRQKSYPVIGQSSRLSFELHVVALDGSLKATIHLPPIKGQKLRHQLFLACG